MADAPTRPRGIPQQPLPTRADAAKCHDISRQIEKNFKKHLTNRKRCSIIATYYKQKADRFSPADAVKLSGAVVYKIP